MLNPIATAGVLLVAAIIFLAVLAGLGAPTSTALFVVCAWFTVYIATPAFAAVVALRYGR